MAAKQVGYKYSWFKNNKAFIKKYDDTKAIVIDSEYSISNLKYY
jgi:hypothetical protein